MLPSVDRCYDSFDSYRQQSVLETKQITLPAAITNIQPPSEFNALSVESYGCGQHIIQVEGGYIVFGQPGAFFVEATHVEARFFLDEKLSCHAEERAVIASHDTLQEYPAIMELAAQGSLNTDPGLTLEELRALSSHVKPVSEICNIGVLSGCSSSSGAAMTLVDGQLWMGTVGNWQKYTKPWASVWDVDHVWVVALDGEDIVLRSLHNGKIELCWFRGPDFQQVRLLKGSTMPRGWFQEGKLILVGKSLFGDVAGEQQEEHVLAVYDSNSVIETTLHPQVFGGDKNIIMKNSFHAQVCKVVVTDRIEFETECVFPGMAHILNTRQWLQNIVIDPFAKFCCVVDGGATPHTDVFVHPGSNTAAACSTRPGVVISAFADGSQGRLLLLNENTLAFIKVDTTKAVRGAVDLSKVDPAALRALEMMDY